MLSKSIRPLLAVSLVAAGACTIRHVDVAQYRQMDAHDMSAMQSEMSSQTVTAAGDVVKFVQNMSIPAGATTVADRLAKSPRHGEYDFVKTGPSDSVRVWVVYPERKDKAPVVVVIHEIYGESTWVRGVADQLAADGYIGVEVNLLYGKTELDHDTVTQAAAQRAISTLKPDDVQRQLAAVAKWAMALPSAQPKYGIVGFCWGGGKSFDHAVLSPPGLAAAVVFYGAPANGSDLSHVNVPVLGFYAGTDARTTGTVPATDSAMHALHKIYEHQTFDGAAHGFMRAQEQSPANATAAEKAWPMAIAFFRKNLGT
jgi:carboxymethylenebutenolidase